MPRPAYRGSRRYQAPNRLSSPKRRRIPNPVEAHSHLESKTRHKPVGQRPPDSDDSDELVKKISQPRTRSPREIYASGAIGKGDTPGGHPTKAQRTRTMRKETDEILRSRSSSASRPDEASSPGKRLPGGDGVASKQSVQPTPKTNPSPKPLQNEVSILGAFKPRKRQPSILQRMSDDDDESSVIHTDDEEQFLPDAISTPVADIKLRSNTSDSKLSTASKKRKRDSDATAETNVLAENTSAMRSRRESRLAEQRTASLPQASRAQTKKLVEGGYRQRQLFRQTQNNSIMALPASSDSEDDNAVLNTRGLTTRSSQTSRRATKTGDLQSLMPSKRHRPKQSMRHRDDFDVIEDSASAHAENEINEQGRSASRTAKATGNRNRAHVNKALAASNKSKRDGKLESMSKTRNKVKEKDKRANRSTAPASVRMDTPLPLSSSRSGNVQAKSSSSKQGDTSSDIVTGRPLAASKGQRYGGSRRTLSNKENEPSYGQSGSAGSKDKTSRSGSVKNEGMENSGPEARAWSSKWAEIDDYSLDFEEVTPPTSSSPMAR